MAQPRRRPVNKRQSAKSFNRADRRTHVYNLKIMRGGWRL